MYAGFPFLIFGVLFGFYLILNVNRFGEGMAKDLRKLTFFELDVLTVKVFIVLLGLIAIGFGIGVFYLFWLDSR